MEMKPGKWTVCWQIKKVHQLKRILASFQQDKWWLLNYKKLELEENIYSQWNSHVHINGASMKCGYVIS